MPVLDLDLDLLMSAAQRAGDIALDFVKRGFDVEEKPDGAGPVTEADLAVDRFLKETLLSARPEYGWLSEESDDDLTRMDRKMCFVVDPIDGTRSFVNGDDSWAHSLAVVQDGQVCAGVVFLPKRGLLYSAGYGQGAYLNSKPIQASAKDTLKDADILTVKRSLSPEFWHNGMPPKFTRSYRPSLAYRMCLVAEGRFDAMMTLRDTWEWDICAGSLIASEAGARVSDRFGHQLSFNQKGAKTLGVLAGAPKILDELHQALEF